MNWSSVSEFAAMGGYGMYVWGSFGATALVLVGEVMSLRARRKALARSADADAHVDADANTEQAASIRHGDYRGGTA